MPGARRGLNERPCASPVIPAEAAQPRRAGTQGLHTPVIAAPGFRVSAFAPPGMTLVKRHPRVSRRRIPRISVECSNGTVPSQRHPLRLVATRRSTSPGFAEGGKTPVTTSRLPPPRMWGRTARKRQEGGSAPAATQPNPATPFHAPPRTKSAAWPDGFSRFRTRASHTLPTWVIIPPSTSQGGQLITVQGCGVDAGERESPCEPVEPDQADDWPGCGKLGSMRGLQRGREPLQQPSPNPAFRGILRWNRPQDPHAGGEQRQAVDNAAVRGRLLNILPGTRGAAISFFYR